MIPSPIILPRSDAKQLLKVLNDNLEFLSDWSNKNELFIHPKKTEYVIFGTAMTRNQIDSDNFSTFLGAQVLKHMTFYKISTWTYT